MGIEDAIKDLYMRNMEMQMRLTALQQVVVAHLGADPEQFSKFVGEQSMQVLAGFIEDKTIPESQKTDFVQYMKDQISGT